MRKCEDCYIKVKRGYRLWLSVVGKKYRNSGKHLNFRIVLSKQNSNRHQPNSKVTRKERECYQHARLPKEWYPHSSCWSIAGA